MHARHLSAYANKVINLIFIAILQKINRQTAPISCIKIGKYRLHVQRVSFFFLGFFAGRLRAFSASPHPLAACSGAQSSS